MGTVFVKASEAVNRAPSNTCVGWTGLTVITDENEEEVPGKDKTVKVDFDVAALFMSKKFLTPQDRTLDLSKIKKSELADPNC